MTFLEDRIARILELRQSGKSTEEISQDLGLTSSVIDSYEIALKGSLRMIGMDSNDIGKMLNVSPLIIDIAQEVYKTAKKSASRYKGKGGLKVLKEEIKKLVSDGLTRTEIAEKLGLSYSWVYHLTKELNHPGLKINHPKEKRLAEIKELFESGTRTYKEMSETTGLTQKYVSRLSRGLGIKLDGKIQEQRKTRREDIDKLIQEGLSLREIGKKVGMSYQGVSLYIKGIDQYEFYREKRREAIQFRDTTYKRRRLLKEVGGLIGLIAIERSQQELWPVQKTVEYLVWCKKNNPGNYTEEMLLKFFSAYKEAQNNGKKLSLKELAGILGGKHPAQARCVLKKSGLEAMHGKQEKKANSPKEKEAMLRAVRLKLGGRDINYFLGLKPHSTGVFYQKKK